MNKRPPTSRDTARQKARNSRLGLASATAVLQQAIEMIDHELDTAREKAEQAQADHEQLLASAEERKETLQAKIDILAS